MGNSLNIGVADRATALDGRPVIIDVANNDFVRIEFQAGEVMMGLPTNFDLPIRSQGTCSTRGPEGTFTITRVTEPSNGVSSINSNPGGVDTITYSPVLGFVGEDTFSYQFVTGPDGLVFVGPFLGVVSSEDLSNEVLVTVTVGEITAPANFLGTSNQQIGTDQALAFVNGAFDVPGQSAALAGTSQAVANGFFAGLANP
jgi:hypothetical protein